MQQEQIEKIRELTKLVEQQKAALNAAAAELKPAFVEYITDKSIDLEERWSFWVAAPKELKNEEPWVSDLEFGGEEISWYEEPMYIDGRGSTVLYVDVVEAYEGLEKPAEHITQLKEDILAANGYSFCWDW
jgi:hypothetical protein